MTTMKPEAKPDTAKPNVDAVIYIRVSSEDQVKNTSLRTQEADCRAFCKRLGYNVVKIFADEGESAKTSNRPHFLELIAWCQKHKPAFCVVWKFERWARNSTDHAIYASYLAKSKTRLLSATEPTEDNPAGRLLETILSGVAQFDNEVRAERSKRSMKDIAMRGGWVVQAPFGYTRGRSGTLPILLHHQDKAPVVTEMFNGIATGRRNVIQTIALAAEHKISSNACRKMLRNPVYAGFVRDSLTNHQEVTAAFPGIIPRQTWITVQAILDGKRVTMSKRMVAREEFPLRSLVRCSVCEGPVTACWSTGRYQKYPYYYCRKGHVRAQADVVHASWLKLLAANQQEFIPVLVELRKDLKEAFLERLKVAGDITIKAAHAHNRIAEQRTRLLDAYLSGDIPKETFTERDKDLSNRYEATKAAAQQAHTWTADVDECVRKAVKLFEDPVALWQRMSLVDRRRFSSALYDGKLMLTPAGVVEPPFGSGLVGAIRDITDPDFNMARLTGALQNLQNTLKFIEDLAA